jgi:hypothetical protein
MATQEELKQLVREKYTVIAGQDYDEGIGAMSDECDCAYKTDGEKDNGKISISYTNHRVGLEQRT